MQLAEALKSNDSKIYFQYEKYSRNNQLKDENYAIIKHIVDSSKDLAQDLATIANKHGLIKQNISKIVQHILDTKNPSQKQLLDLYDVTQNKIYLEGQYAKIVLLLSKNDPSKLLDVNIDTIQLDRYEKLSFILQQFECLVKLQQFSKVELLAKKVNMNVLKDYPAENKTYYQLLAKYYLAVKNFQKLGQTYATLYQLEKSSENLKNCFYTFLAEYSMEQIHELQQLIKYDHPFKSFLKQVVGNELITENISFPDEILQLRIQQHVIFFNLECQSHEFVLL
eukprot:NODE_330_length_9451_cov_0.342173.p6 type:complete len:281 gc:universal NODE_330_length_9451_cov_0.342173:9416-8574(-)